MKIEEVIYAKLRAEIDAAVPVFVGDAPPQTTVPPWVYFMLNESEPDQSIQGDRTVHKLEVDTLAASYSAVAALSDVVVGSLHGFFGAPVARCLWKRTARSVIDMQERGLGYHFVDTFYVVSSSRG